MTTTAEVDFDQQVRDLCNQIDDAQDAATILSPSPQEAVRAAELPALRLRAAAMFNHSLSPAQRALFECVKPMSTATS
jgi:hypothetical protein